MNTIQIYKQELKKSIKKLKPPCRPEILELYFMLTLN